MAEGKRSDDKTHQPRKERIHELPPGVRLLRTLEGHEDAIRSLAFDSAGCILASGSIDNTIRLWELHSGRLLHTLKGHWTAVNSVAFDPENRMLASGGGDNVIKLWEPVRGTLLHTLVGDGRWIVWSVAFGPGGRILASGGEENTIKLWDPTSGALLLTLDGHHRAVTSIAFHPAGQILASGSEEGTVKLWETQSGKLLQVLEGHRSQINSIAFDPAGHTLASGSADNTIKLWKSEDGRLLRTLEGHTGSVDGVAFSRVGSLLASKSRDHTVCLWRYDTGAPVVLIPALTKVSWFIGGLAFHPDLPMLTTVASEPETPEVERCQSIHVWGLDLDVLLAKAPAMRGPPRAMHHSTAKIALVGDHSVGKSALGHRMIHGEFKEQASTHGQQFWVCPALGKRRADDTECEAILWDFGGQPDYRLVHALFVDDADLALVLFDASDLRDPLHGVGFWLKQLRTVQRCCPIILVAAQTDRGTCALTPDELSAFCHERAVVGPIHTSALTGAGVAELIERMKLMIPWDDKPATVTTTTFKRIKDYVLGLKQAGTDGRSIVTPEELRGRLEAIDVDWSFSDAEMMTAVGHLENYGYVKRLRTSKADERVLLAAELLNNLASSFVLEARRNPRGLGSLEEKRLFDGGYAFPELARLTEAERDILLDAATLLFLEHNVCFRETDPLRMEPYLVFPELINLKKPVEEERATEDGVAYTVTGPTENVFASLVVLLGYTHTFTRTNQWQNNARYEVGDGLACGFRQEAERDGELDFVLCFGPNVGQPVRTLFQGLFESFLARRNLTVMRYEPVRCANADCGHLLERSVVRQRMREGKTFAFCNECGERLTLPRMAEPIQLTKEIQAEVDEQRRTAEQRTRFEQAVFRVQTYVTEQKIQALECFISYAWGVAEHERWVEKRLATDLQKAGIKVVLDRWHNAQVGANVARFVARIEKSDRVITVGTPLYRRKYENKDTSTGYVVAAEVDMIDNRLLGTEPQKASVLPLLLAGEKTESLPPLLHGRVYADFRNDEAYFRTAFDLILSLYGIPQTDPAVVELRESLGGVWMR